MSLEENPDDAGLPEPLPWQRPFVDAAARGENIVMRASRRGPVWQASKGQSPANTPMGPCPACGQRAVMSTGVVRRHPAKARFGDSVREPLCPASGTVIPPGKEDKG